jgi:hypothetical protein
VNLQLASINNPVKGIAVVAAFCACPGESQGHLDVCPTSPKFACPGDSGAMGEPDVRSKSACPCDCVALGKPDVRSPATKLACPCDGGAMGEPDVSLPSFFFLDGDVANTARPLRRRRSGVFAINPAPEISVHQ